MSDGSSLRQSWYDALHSAETHFRQLLGSHSSPEWKRVANSVEGGSRKGKSRISAVPELADVVVHRNSSRPGDDIYRLVLDAPSDDTISLEPWKAVLATPELRQEWDPAVEDAHLVEMFDHNTRITKTNFTLGWPANPRDAVTISRSFHDTSTLIDISTSLPRSPDEPSYLRPSPPYVRSNVTLFAWCIQYVQPSNPTTPGNRPEKKISAGRIRMTCFWQHDLKAAWNFTSSSSIIQQLSTMILGLLKTVIKRSFRVPKLAAYGNGVSIERVRFQIDREALTIDYTIIPEEEDHSAGDVAGMNELQTRREQKRLTRAIECVLPSCEGWDVQVTTKASSEEVERLPWSTHASRSSGSSQPDQLTLRFSHAPLIDDHSVLKVRVVIEISGPSSGLRLNGLPQTVLLIEDRDPSASNLSQQILQDVTSTADLSFNTMSSLGSSTTTPSTVPNPVISPNERTTAAEKSILSRVRRNYIYFSSLLQEPEAKWRRTTESRGVSITQLDSIDPTLVVYRAEATFVGVGLWDLYGAVVSPGAKIYWDKTHEDAVLLEDINELSELWHFKTRPAWPINGRDSVVLKTVYKSPTTIHVFSFSADDPHLFPNIPPTEPNVIRTQVDLQGWAIEALSPTTTLLTLLEQSDPKGWTNKTSIPTQMINNLAGIGEFAIKCGGPPVVTRLAGAKANEIKYDHEKASFRIEYEASGSRRPSAPDSQDRLPTIECEVRCDIDTWAPSLDIVVDPPPQSMSCLRRHRLSVDGGGLWLSLTHEAMFVDEDRLLLIIRRAPGKERGLVMVNGSKISVDVEEMPEHEIKTLTKQKRVKPPRIPLDQPPVVGVIRKRRAEWDADAEGNDAGSETGTGAGAGGGWASAPKISSPLARFWTYAAVAAISPVAAGGIGGSVPSPLKMPMQYALEVLAWTQEFHSCGSADGWVLVSDKGITIQRKLISEISPSYLVSAEELASIITEKECRKKWDDRFDSMRVLESFGGESKTLFGVSKTGFPFRDRGFYLASVLARSHTIALSSRRNTTGGIDSSNGGRGGDSTRNAIFCVSASFSPDSVASFSPAKYNPYGLPIGRVYLDAWILETLDPYSKENYAIPSTRCTRLVAVDYAGSIPAAMNTIINASLPRAILSVESYFRSAAPSPVVRLPAPGVVALERRGEERWDLRDDGRLLAKAGWEGDGRVYRAVVVAMIPGAEVVEKDISTPRPSKFVASPVRRDDTSEAPATLPSPPTSPPGHQSVPPAMSGNGISSSPTPTPTQSALRGRSSTSAFTSKGEVRPPSDMVVAELVVDAKTYPEGYRVVLLSQMRRNTGYFTSTLSEAPELKLPLHCTIHTIPSSPLHSSHLLPTTPSSPSMVILPTAQYQLSAVKDPLTGEVRGGKEWPKWYEGLQCIAGDKFGGAVVGIEVQPSPDAPSPSNGAAVGSKAAGGSIEKGKDVVTVVGTDGVASTVDIIGEKESLTSIGREELLDERVGKMGVLSRLPNEAEPLPDELKIPLAVADDLLDDFSTNSTASSPNNASATGADTGEASQNEQTRQESTSKEETQDVHVNNAPSRMSLMLIDVYLIEREGFQARCNSSATKRPWATSQLLTGSTPMPPGGLETAQFYTRGSRRLHPTSTIIIIAIMAFLVGSLLRSLVSPADFVHIVTEDEAKRSVQGWRELRRLVEVKYVAGGWDLQLAVVRRH
ncbi:hypothetical protein BD779DRAFT_1611394 [Infundibulicybe gibba]|nr:hypothetical protein BD779DRAFT_1611394 [Infundibulicybe gibba]